VRRRRQPQGKAVQVDPNRPMLKPPGAERLKLHYDKTAVNFCIQIQLAPLQQEGVRVQRPRPGLLPQRVLRGQAVQVDPIKPELKSPGSTCLKLKYHEPLSKVAFKFNLRRYTVGRQEYSEKRSYPTFAFGRAAGANTRPLLSST
jgi:hypothetical protein